MKNKVNIAQCNPCHFPLWINSPVSSKATIHFGSTENVQKKTTQEALLSLDKLEDAWKDAVGQYRKLFETKQEERNKAFGLTGMEKVFNVFGLDISGDVKIKNEKRPKESPEELALKSVANRLGHQVDEERKLLGEVVRLINGYNQIEKLLMQQEKSQPAKPNPKPLKFGTYSTMSRASDRAYGSYDPPPPPPSWETLRGIFTPQPRNWSGDFPTLAISGELPGNKADISFITEDH